MDSKREESAIKGGTRLSDDFRNVKGDLALLKNGRYQKYCRICCMQLQSDDYRLRKHF